jgi:serine protease Do
MIWQIVFGKEGSIEMKRSLLVCSLVLVACSSVVGARASHDIDQQTPERPRRVQLPGSSFLGVELGEVSREAVERLKLRDERGALIEGVTAGSGAAEAGLQKNDVIVKWNGESIESARELSRRIRETPAGRVVRLGVIRDGREIEVNAKLREGRVAARTIAIDRTALQTEAARARAQARAAVARSKEQAREATTRAREHAREATARAREQATAAARVHDQLRSTARLGVELQSMTPQLAEYFGLSKRTGALVVFVFADSPAAKAGLKAGDVILSAGGETVESPMDLRRALTTKSEGPIELRILRDKQERTLTAQLQKASSSSLLELDDIGGTIRASIAPMVIQIPSVAIQPMSIQVPAIKLDTIKIEMPELKIHPIVVPKIDIAPIKIDGPKIQIRPINIKLAPVRIIV